MNLIDDFGKEVELIVYSGDGDEWSALYVDGELHTVGDSYLIDEAIRSLVGVRTVGSSSYMRGGNQRSSVAKTIAEIEAYDEHREAEMIRNDISKAEEELREAEEKVQKLKVILKDKS